MIINTYQKLINKHMEDDCIILSSGPSLYDFFYKNFDLNIFKNKVIISVNASIIACKEKLSWFKKGQKRYWISNDSLTTRWNWFKIVENGFCIKIIRNSWLKQNHHGNTEGFLFFSPRKEQFEKINFNEIGLMSCSSTPSAIDLAIQMGCKNIYLIGVDHCRKDNKRYFWEYFSKQKRPIYKRLKMDKWQKQKKIFQQNLITYKRLNEFAKFKNSKIYNCSKLFNKKNDIFEYKNI